MPLCCFIRHGQTALPALDAAWGSRFDVPLTAAGQAESRALGHQLAAWSFGHLFSSDLRRAVQAACLIAPSLGIPITAITPALRDWDIGTLSGLSIRLALPKLCYYLRNARVPVPGGESFHVFSCRILQGLADLMTDYWPPPYAIVAHRRVERVLAAWNPTNGTLDIDRFLEPTMSTAGFVWYELNCEALLQAEGLRAA